MIPRISGVRDRKSRACSYIKAVPYYPCFVTGLLPLFYLIDNVTFNINPVLLSQLARAKSDLKFAGSIVIGACFEC